MKVQWTDEEAGTIMRLAHPTEFSTGLIMKNLLAMYQANLEEDIAWIIESLEEEKSA